MTEFDQRRSALLADRTIGGRAFARAYAALVDEWLAGIYTQRLAGADAALVAVGGYGRSELAPESDLDVLLLCEGRVAPDAIADLWYPVWNTGIKLGHAVRTTKDTLKLAANDLDTATALLSARHIAGDERLVGRLREKALARWVKDGRRWRTSLAEAVSVRHAISPDVAFALEPDLKIGRGGLRDVHAIDWALATGARAPDDLGDLRTAYDLLLDVRVALHRRTGRPVERLALDRQEEVAQDLQLRDADHLMSLVAAAGRAIGWSSDEFWFDLADHPAGRALTDLPVIIERGRVKFVHGVPPDGPGWAEAVLEAATVAARTGARLHPSVLIHTGEPTIPDPWPDSLRRAFLDLLAVGPGAIPVIEALDRGGLWTRLLPEWEPTRSRPQRNPYHRFTVDRHLLEATAIAATLPSPRPDLLLLGTLLHDIGKGHTGDHSESGRELAAPILNRLGVAPEDAALVEILVAEHLLLPDIATRRDLDDPAVVTDVASRLGSVECVDLAVPLAEADGRATGPTAWSAWKSELVSVLADRVRHVLGGGEVTDVVDLHPFSEETLGRVQAASPVTAPVVEVDGDRLLVMAPDRPGMFSRVAGVLALHGLDILDAVVGAVDGVGVDELRVVSSFDVAIPWDRVSSDLARALDRRLAIQARLARRATSYSSTGPHLLDPRVSILNDETESATLVEVVGPSSIGLLYRLASALADLDLDIRRAKITTIGSDFVDVFYVVEGDRPVTDPQLIDELRLSLLHAIGGTR